MGSPVPFVLPQYFGNTAAFLSAGTLDFYAAGTVVRKNTYSDIALTTPNANPVVLDSTGRKRIYLEEGSYYVVLKDSLGNTIWSEDNVPGSTGSGVASYQLVDSVAALKALSGGSSSYVQLGGYYTGGDGGGGLFHWSSASSTAEDGGVVFTPNSAPATGRWIRVYSGKIDVRWFGAKADSVTTDSTSITNANTYVQALTNGGVLYFPASSGKYLYTINPSFGSKVTVEMEEGAELNSSAVACTFSGRFIGGNGKHFSTSSGTLTINFGVNSVDEVKVEWFGGKGDNSSDNSIAIVAAIASFGSNLGVVAFGKGTYKYSTALVYNTNATNGIALVGQGRFNTILQYTGAVDGLTFGGNHNGFRMQDMRFYSTTGRDAIVFRTNPTAYPTPDGGVFDLVRLDIRGWLRHGIVQGLTVATRTDHLEVTQNGGSGIVFESVSTKATTWQDTGSWFHSNGGHGIVLDGPTSVSLSGTISDSNTGSSTEAQTIKYAGYTMIGGGVYTNCVPTDIGKNVVQGGVTLGTLAHYDNTVQEWVVNATVVPATSGALSISTGTGASTTTATRQKNSHGLYARNLQGLSWIGGHTENHIYGAFLDNVYDSTIAPGKGLTQGTNAWGVYAASTSSRILFFGTSIDVQAGGAGDIYFGPLTIGMVLFGGHGASGYTFTNRSQDAMVVTAMNALPITMDFKSTAQVPYALTGYHATGCLLQVGSGSTSGYAGIRMTVNGFTKDMYLDKTTADLFLVSTGLAKNVALLGSATDRANQRLYWAKSDGTKIVMIGADANQLTGSDANGNFTVDLYSDSGTLLVSAIECSRSAYWIQIPAGKSTNKAKLGGTWQTSISSTGSVNAAETDLYSVSVPANMLSRDGETLEFVAFGTYAGNANAKRIKVYFGATAAFNSGALVMNGSQWSLRGTIMRISATTQIVTITFGTNDAVQYSLTQYSTPAETLSGAITFRVTGQATTTNDIVETGMRVEWKPAA